MDSKSPRRWFRFSLRSMFILVTLLACWLGWESHVVRQRKAARDDIQQNAAFGVVTAGEWAKRAAPNQQKSIPSVSWMRRLLGDEAIQQITYDRHIKGFSEVELTRLKEVFPEAEAFELLPIPCHPGCFPSGTLFATPRGAVPIEKINVGDRVATIGFDGEPSLGAARAIFTTENRLWRITTDAGELLTTETQPLCKSLAEIVPAGELQPGDAILYQGESTLRLVQVLSVEPTDRIEKVFNLVLGDSELFIANGFLARSKPPVED